MKKTIILPIFISVLTLFLFIGTDVLAAISITEPGTDTTWDANPHLVRWTYEATSYYAGCIWKFRLIPYSNSLLPTYGGRLDLRGNSESLGSIFPTGSITNSLFEPVPGEYKVQVECFLSGGLGETVTSDKKITVTNSAYNPLFFPFLSTEKTINLPTILPLGVQVNVDLDSQVLNGVAVDLVLFKKSDGSTAWSGAWSDNGNFISTNSLYPYFGTSITAERLNAISPEIYAIRAVVRYLGGMIIKNSADITIQSATPATTLNTHTAGAGAPGSVVLVDPNLSSYVPGASVRLTADPAVNSTFSGWSGSISTTNNPTTVIMDSSKDITANFDLTGTQPPVSTKFNTGDQITTTGGRVRATPYGSSLGTQPADTRGVVVDDPQNGVYKSIDYWWKIDYTSGPDGWTGESLLNKYTGGIITPPITGGDPPGWQNPPAGTPPDCDDPNTIGCWPPINVSSLEQWKRGLLIADELQTYSLGTGNFRLVKGPALTGEASGLVLTSDADGFGSWRPAGGGPPDSSGVSQIIAGSNITISPTSGTGAVTINSSGGTGPGLTGLNCSDDNNQKLLWNGSNFFCGNDQRGAIGSGISTLTAGTGLAISTQNTGGSITTSSGTIKIRTDCATGQVLKFNSVSATWNCDNDISNTSPTGGTVTSVDAGSGLAVVPNAAGGSITTNGTLSLRRNCNFGQVLKWTENVGGVSGNSQWMCMNDDAGGATASNMSDDSNVIKGLYSSNLNGVLQFKSLKAGPNITLNSTDKEITISALLGNASDILRNGPDDGLSSYAKLNNTGNVGSVGIGTKKQFCFLTGVVDKASTAAYEHGCILKSYSDSSFTISTNPSYLKSYWKLYASSYTDCYVVCVN